MSRRLPNYLKSYRKHAGLSQAEVAFLLGCKSGAKVSRYECAARLPGFLTGLAYEVVLGVPARELFAGAYETVEDATRKHAHRLLGRLRSEHPSKKRDLKLLRLEALTGQRKQ